MRVALGVLALGALGCSIQAEQGEVGIYQAPASGGAAAMLPDPAAARRRAIRATAESTIGASAVYGTVRVLNMVHRRRTALAIIGHGIARALALNPSFHVRFARLARRTLEDVLIRKESVR